MAESDWITDTEIEPGKERSASAIWAIILVLLTFVFIPASWYHRSALMFVMCVPVLWIVAIILGALAVMAGDRLGYAAVGLAYLTFLGVVALMFY